MLQNKWLSHKKQFATFVMYGIVNTAITYLLYLLFLQVMHYQIAYFLSYALGIGLAYFLNVRFVFKTQSTLKKAAYYPLIYVIQYMIGALLFYILVELLQVGTFWAPLLVIFSLVPISYGLNKVFLRA